MRGEVSLAGELGQNRWTRPALQWRHEQPLQSAGRARRGLTPYYVAVFTTVRTQDQSGYSETSARMEDLVKESSTGTPAVYGFAARNGRTLADNAPEATLSLVFNTPPSVSAQQRTASFSYVVAA